MWGYVVEDLGDQIKSKVSDRRHPHMNHPHCHRLTERTAGTTHKAVIIEVYKVVCKG